ncbi:MAG: hypothetical protein KAX77_04895 [Xanthomonadales bacterium]|nr:hypothetical protein [Xanthomonadales bacterium]
MSAQVPFGFYARRLQSPAQAERSAKVGMDRAAERADKIEPDWFKRALSIVRTYALTHRAERFPAEKVVEYARALGLPDPPDGRAWGAVMRAARTEGAIAADGYMPTVSSNGSPKVAWRAA